MRQTESPHLEAIRPFKRHLATSTESLLLVQNFMDDKEKAITDALKLVGRFVAARYPNSAAALLAGSAARGENKDSSDYDVVILFNSLPEGAWREMANFEGHDFEVFAHDLSTLSYFFKQIDVPSGRPVLVRMVAEGLPIELTSSSLVATAK